MKTEDSENHNLRIGITAQLYLPRLNQTKSPTSKTKFLPLFIQINTLTISCIFTSFLVPSRVTKLFDELKILLTSLLQEVNVAHRNLVWLYYSENYFPKEKANKIFKNIIMRIKKLKYLLAYNNVTKIVADKMNKLEFNFLRVYCIYLVLRVVLKFLIWNF